MADPGTSVVTSDVNTADVQDGTNSTADVPPTTPATKRSVIIGNLEVNESDRKILAITRSFQSLQSFWVSVSIAGIIVLVVVLIVCTPQLVRKYAAPLRRRRRARRREASIQWDRDYSLDRYLPRRSCIQLDTRFVTNRHVKPAARKPASRSGVLSSVCCCCVPGYRRKLIASPNNYSMNTLLACLHSTLDGTTTAAGAAHDHSTPGKPGVSVLSSSAHQKQPRYKKHSVFVKERYAEFAATRLDGAGLQNGVTNVTFECDSGSDGWGDEDEDDGVRCDDDEVMAAAPGEGYGGELEEGVGGDVAATPAAVETIEVVIENEVGVDAFKRNTRSPGDCSEAVATAASVSPVPRGEVCVARHQRVLSWYEWHLNLYTEALARHIVRSALKHSVARIKEEGFAHVPGKSFISPDDEEAIRRFARSVPSNYPPRGSHKHSSSRLVRTCKQKCGSSMHCSKRRHERELSAHSSHNKANRVYAITGRKTMCNGGINELRKFHRKQCFVDCVYNFSPRNVHMGDNVGFTAKPGKTSLVYPGVEHTSRNHLSKRRVPFECGVEVINEEESRKFSDSQSEDEIICAKCRICKRQKRPAGRNVNKHSCRGRSHQVFIDDRMIESYQPLTCARNTNILQGKHRLKGNHPTCRTLKAKYAAKSADDPILFENEATRVAGKHVGLFSTLQRSINDHKSSVVDVYRGMDVSSIDPSVGYDDIDKMWDCARSTGDHFNADVGSASAHLTGTVGSHLNGIVGGESVNVCMPVGSESTDADSSDSSEQQPAADTHGRGHGGHPTRRTDGVYVLDVLESTDYQQCNTDTFIELHSIDPRRSNHTCSSYRGKGQGQTAPPPTVGQYPGRRGPDSVTRDDEDAVDLRTDIHNHLAVGQKLRPALGPNRITDGTDGVSAAPGSAGRGRFEHKVTLSSTDL